MKRFSVLVITFAFIGSTMANAIQFSVEREGDHLDVVFVTDLTTFRDISRIARQFLEGLSCDVMAGLGDDGALVIRAYNFFTAEETTETDMALIGNLRALLEARFPDTVETSDDEPDDGSSPPRAEGPPRDHYEFLLEVSQRLTLLSGGSGIIDIAAGRHNSNND